MEDRGRRSRSVLCVDDEEWIELRSRNLEFVDKTRQEEPDGAEGFNLCR